MTEGSQYDESYYIHGKTSGKSLYENYHWMPELTIPMARKIADHCHIVPGVNSVLDFGCARGYLVRAFCELGFEAWGMDCSQWAVDNCDDAVKGYIECTTEIPKGMDWIIAKDVLEHVPNVADVIADMQEKAVVGIFVVVPLAPFDGEPYIVADYEKDVTHIHRLSLASWARFFMRPGWRVEAMYRLRGVKDNYKIWENGNGFITARRIFE